MAQKHWMKWKNRVNRKWANHSRENAQCRISKSPLWMNNANVWRHVPRTKTNQCSWKLCQQLQKRFLVIPDRRNVGNAAWYLFADHGTKREIVGAIRFHQYLRPMVPTVSVGPVSAIWSLKNKWSAHNFRHPRAGWPKKFLQFIGEHFRLHRCCTDNRNRCSLVDDLRKRPGDKIWIFVGFIMAAFIIASRSSMSLFPSPIAPKTTAATAIWWRRLCK